MTYYLADSTGAVWRWDDAPGGLLEPVAELPDGERVAGNVRDCGEWFEVRLDSQPKMPREVCGGKC